jgi:RimJ/RimL family protein N-acetyltransferase
MKGIKIEEDHMEKWEYTTMKVNLKGLNGGILEIENFDHELNQLGEFGWELVSCFSTNGGNGYGREAVAVFKRKK